MAIGQVIVENTVPLSTLNKRRIGSIEGLRGFAVALVFLVHFASAILPYVAESSLSHFLLSGVHRVGNIGVDLFFIISGYLIYPIVLRSDFAFWPFIYRRIQRIYPTFLAVLLLYLLLSVVFESHSKLPVGAVNTLIYILQNLLLLPGITAIEPIITVAWSLSYEMLFYCSLPLLLLLPPLRSLAVSQRLLFWLLLATVGFLGSFVWGGPIRMLMFVAGIIIYELQHHLDSGANPSSSHQSANSIGGITLLLAVVALMLLPDLPAKPKYLLLFFVLGLFCWSCFLERGVTARLLAWLPLRWLGNRSYSYYIIHGLAIQALFLFIGKLPAGLLQNSWLPWLLLPLVFVLTLLPAWLLFHGIEKPFSLDTKEPQKVSWQ